MPGRVKRKSTAPKIGSAIRHQYQPHDVVVDEAWKVIYPSTSPLIPVTLDRGTFEFLWQFVDRKGKQADASNFHYSDIHRGVYQRAADQFAEAAKVQLGEGYTVTDGAKAAKPAEVSETPVKRRRRRKPAETTAKTFEASESPVGPSNNRRRRKTRSAATSK